MKGKIVLIILLFSILQIQVSHAKKYYERFEINLPDYTKYQPIDLTIFFKNPCYAINENKHSIRILYNGKEIESQIYNLKFENEKRISKCNIVFLYQGKGEYLIEYGEEIEEKNYEDHVDVIDAYYYIEPIPKYFAKINYYAIKENDEIVFGICQEGNVLGIEMANKVIKLKDNSKEFEMQNWEQMFSFAFFYSKEFGTDERLLRKSIVVDGNLMVRVMIESISNNKKAKTIAIYTYYYSPLKEKRLFVSLKHEIYEQLYGNATYAYLMCVKSRSRAINELNMGEILPYIHVNGKNGIEEYKLDTNPENKRDKWIISSNDNVILGNPPWISIDDKKIAYAFILSIDEMIVTAVEREEVGIPGLEIDGAGIGVGKSGLIKNFEGNIEFFYGKYDEVEKEAEAFSKFANLRKFSYKEGKRVEEYNLSIIVNFRKSFFLMGIKIPHLEAEVWNDDLIAKGIINFGRISFKLPKGNYIVKIFWVGKKSKFIGLKYVELNKNKKIHIFCTFEGKIKIKTKEGVKAVIYKEGIVAENVSNGEVILKAPSLNKYKLKLIYKGITIYEENIFLFFKLTRKYFFNTYYLKLKLVDKFNLPLGINITPTLFANDFLIYANKKGDFFYFEDLPKGTYNLIISYKGYRINKTIKMIGNKEIKIIFPAEYYVKVKAYDSRGFPIKAKIIFERDGIEFEKNLLPPADYKLKILIDGKVIASREIFVKTNEEYEIVTRKFSIYPIIFPLIILIYYIIFKFKYRSIIPFLISFSIIFSWWNIKSKSSIFLYIFPPKMIEFHETYGKLVFLPNAFKMALLAILFFLLLSIALSLHRKLFKFSLIPLSMSILIFIYSLNKFAKITVGSMFGKGIEANWGFGIGFYFALASLFLMAIKVIMDEVRRSC